MSSCYLSTCKSPPSRRGLQLSYAPAPAVYRHSYKLPANTNASVEASGHVPPLARTSLRMGKYLPKRHAQHITLPIAINSSTRGRERGRERHIQTILHSTTNEAMTLSKTVQLANIQQQSGFRNWKINSSALVWMIAHRYPVIMGCIMRNGYSKTTVFVPGLRTKFFIVCLY